MSAHNLLLALPGIAMIAAAALLLTRKDDTREPKERLWDTVLLTTVILTAALGSVLRLIVEDAQLAYALNMALMVTETALHVALVGWVAYLPSRHARWLRTKGAALVASATCAVLFAWLAFDPSAFIGRIGPLDGVPALVRLDAGPGSVAWGALAITVRTYALFAAVDALRHGPPGWARRPDGVAITMGLFLATFLVWSSTPIFIFLTGEPWLPGVARFLLPTFGGACLLAAMWCARPLTGSERPVGPDT